MATLYKENFYGDRNRSEENYDVISELDKRSEVSSLGAMHDHTMVKHLAKGASEIYRGRIVDSKFPRDAWDNYVYGANVTQDVDGTFRMAYIAYSTSSIYGPAIATSSDLLNWTKPNIGAINHTAAQGGDDTTNNNLTVIHSGHEVVDLLRTGASYWLMVIKTPTSNMVYDSTDGLNFDYVSTPILVASHGATSCEAKCLIYVEHLDVWRMYYSQDHDINRRSIGYYESATNSLTSTFTDQGVIADFNAQAMGTDGATKQFYDIKIWPYANRLWAAVNRYNSWVGHSIAYQLGPLELWCSDDYGKTFKYMRPLLLNGLKGVQWDNGLISIARPIEVGAGVNGEPGVWMMVYTASNSTHNIWPRDMDFGLAVGTSF